MAQAISKEQEQHNFHGLETEIQADPEPGVCVGEAGATFFGNMVPTNKKMSGVLATRWARLTPIQSLASGPIS
eukprot:312773-Pelagomonas_calceolata.AAC.3